MTVDVICLGKKKYDEALSIQRKLFDMRQEGKIHDTMIITEHFPVLTLGRRGKAENITISEEALGEMGVDVHRTNRGGDVTYHGSGQLVVYFIFDLRNHAGGVKEFVWKIEEVIMRFLKEKYDIDSERGEKKYTGIWIGDKKIAAFGIFVSHWITMHGFSFNVNTDMSHFGWINPCGITDKGVTSLEMQLKKRIDMNEITDDLLDQFKKVFKSGIEIRSLEEICDGAEDAKT